MEEPGRLQSMGSRIWAPLSDFTFTFHVHALEKEMATHSSVLAWRIPGMGEPGGLQFMGSHRVGHDWSDLAAAAASKQDKKQRSSGKQVKKRWWYFYFRHISLKCLKNTNHYWIKPLLLVDVFFSNYLYDEIFYFLLDLSMIFLTVNLFQKG